MNPVPPDMPIPRLNFLHFFLVYLTLLGGLSLLLPRTLFDALVRIALPFLPEKLETKR